MLVQTRFQSVKYVEIRAAYDELVERLHSTERDESNAAAPKRGYIAAEREQSSTVRRRTR